MLYPLSYGGQRITIAAEAISTLCKIFPLIWQVSACHGTLPPVKQPSLRLNLSARRTRKQDFLAQMRRVVPWAALVDLIAPYDPEGKNGRPAPSSKTPCRPERLASDTPASVL